MTQTRVAMRPGAYFDSIVLMLASARMSGRPDVEADMACMATPATRSASGSPSCATVEA